MKKAVRRNKVVKKKPAVKSNNPLKLHGTLDQALKAFIKAKPVKRKK